MKKSWAKLILKNSACIFRIKDQIRSAGNVGKTFALIAALIFWEIVLLVISLPSYIFLSRQKITVDQTQYQKEIRSYQLRRKITISALAIMTLVWGAKWGTVSFLTVTPSADEITRAEDQSLEWDFQNAQDYTTDSDAFIFQDGNIIFAPNATQDTSPNTPTNNTTSQEENNIPTEQIPPNTEKGEDSSTTETPQENQQIPEQNTQEETTSSPQNTNHSQTQESKEEEEEEEDDDDDDDDDQYANPPSEIPTQPDTQTNTTPSPSEENQTPPSPQNNSAPLNEENTTDQSPQDSQQQTPSSPNTQTDTEQKEETDTPQDTQITPDNSQSSQSAQDPQPSPDQIDQQTSPEEEEEDDDDDLSDQPQIPQSQQPTPETTSHNWTAWIIPTAAAQETPDTTSPDSPNPDENTEIENTTPLPSETPKQVDQPQDIETQDTTTPSQEITEEQEITPQNPTPSPHHHTPPTSDPQTSAAEKKKTPDSSHQTPTDIEPENTPDQSPTIPQDTPSDQSNEAPDQSENQSKSETQPQTPTTKIPETQDTQTTEPITSPHQIPEEETEDTQQSTPSTTSNQDPIDTTPSPDPTQPQPLPDQDPQTPTPEVENNTCTGTLTSNAATPPHTVRQWTAFQETATKHTGTITYQLSPDDGSTWYAFTNDQWQQTQDHSNTADQINQHIPSFPVPKSGLSFRAFFQNDCITPITLHSIHINYITTNDHPVTLVAEWNFDQSQGAIAYDTITQSELIAARSQWTPGIRGNALSLTHPESRLFSEIKSLYHLSQDMSIYMWIKIDTFPQQKTPLILFQTEDSESSVHNIPLALFIHPDGKLSYLHEHANGNDQHVTFHAPSLQQDTWHLITLTRDTTEKTVTLSIDTTNSEQHTYQHNPDGGDRSKIILASHSANSFAHFPFHIDDLFLYDGIVPVESITKYYHNHQPTPEIIGQDLTCTSRLFSHITWQQDPNINSISYIHLTATPQTHVPHMTIKHQQQSYPFIIDTQDDDSHLITAHLFDLTKGDLIHIHAPSDDECHHQLTYQLGAEKDQ